MRSLLVLSHVVPHPPDTGVHTRTFNLWRQLAREFRIRALCFHRSEGGRLAIDAADSAEALRSIADVSVFPVPQDESRLRLMRDHASSVLRRRSYTVPMYDSPAFSRALAVALASEEFDLVQLETLDLAAHIPAVLGRRTACTHHNVESDLLARRSMREENPALAAYMRLQSRLMRDEEKRWCPRLDLNLVVSERDRDRLAEIAPGTTLSVVPNGVDIDQFMPVEGGESGVAFTGGTMYYPNRDALAYFAAEILPLLRKSDPDLLVNWIGRATPEEVEEFGARGVRLTGRVADVRPLVAQAGCFVVPLRVGGGTRLKILEAWAMGKAVVTTTIGCEGLAAVDGQNCLVRDTASGFADAVVEVLGRTDLRRRLGESGRATVEERYSWDAIGQDLLGSYRQLLTR